MIEFLSNWIKGIAFGVIIVSIFEMLLPNGNLKKYIKIVLGIYVVLCILLPFTKNNVLGDFDLAKKFENYTENLSTNGEKSNNEYKLNKIYEDTFEREITQTIEKEGFKVHKCEVKGIFNADKENAGISKIKVVIESKKVIKNKNEKNEIDYNGQNEMDYREQNEMDNKDVKENVEENSEIRVENVTKIEKVEKVKVRVGNSNTYTSEEDVNSKDIDTLRKFLSKHYEIDKDIIDVSIL